MLIGATIGVAMNIFVPQCSPIIGAAVAAVICPLYLIMFNSSEDE